VAKAYELMMTHVQNDKSTTEVLCSNMDHDGVYVEGDDNVMITDYNMEDEFMLAADIFGLQITLEQNHHSEGYEFCKITVSESMTGKPASMKNISSSFLKLGWSPKNFKVGSRREALLVQSRLMMFNHTYPQITEFKNFSKMVLDQLNPKFITLDPYTMTI
jgi:hypothetical protein